MEDGFFQFLLRLANDRKLSLTQLLDTYDSVELSLWLAYDQTIGIEDPHYDMAGLQYIIANQYAKKERKFTDFLNRARPAVDIRKHIEKQKAIFASKKDK